MATMRYDDHKTTAQHNNAAPIRRVDARTHDKTHNKTTPLLLAKRGVHASSCDYMIPQLSHEYSDTSYYDCCTTSIQVPHISCCMCTSTSVYVGPLWVHRPHTYAICAVRTCFGIFLSFHVTAVYGRNQQRRGIADEHGSSTRSSSSNNNRQCGLWVLPTLHAAA